MRCCDTLPIPRFLVLLFPRPPNIRFRKNHRRAGQDELHLVGPVFHDDAGLVHITSTKEDEVMKSILVWGLEFIMSFGAALSILGGAASGYFYGGVGGNVLGAIVGTIGAQVRIIDMIEKLIFCFSISAKGETLSI